MLTMPKSAPVGSPKALVRGGSAWNARYRYDDPSISVSVGIPPILSWPNGHRPFTWKAAWALLSSSPRTEIPHEPLARPRCRARPGPGTPGGRPDRHGSEADAIATAAGAQRPGRQGRGAGPLRAEADRATGAVR